ncbi:hypothetical protein EIP91_011174 [Steccherinum ochraceum]|uniref:Fungal-type protein kinase domain-containing protein n=1 Tax=Steccherinum ochraceum TaxID=92696 RepID=A0A4R0RQ58_9APHY|nr:hypothetical protein EIP91_011174 [Steccherinum ochraceum]
MSVEAWVGPLDPRVFLKRFMKVTQKLPTNKLSGASFEAVPSQLRTEEEISTSLMHFAQKSKLLRKGFSFCSSFATSSNDQDTRPPLSIHLNNTGSHGEYWRTVELGVAVFPDSAMDPFPTCSSNHTPQSIPSSKQAKRLRKQLATYAASQFDRQHRTFLFSLVICGHHARFLRWDRAGVLVSASFNYLEDARPLAEFVWRYGRLLPADRGVDPTSRLCTTSEEASLRQAVKAHISMLRHIPGVESALESDHPFYHVTITDTHSETRNYIIQKSFCSPSAPVGRATRAYIALDTSTQRLVFLKDYWRPADSSRPSEAETYRALEDAHIPHLPNVHWAGDVIPGLQTTMSQVWQDSDKQWPCEMLRGYRHHRVVQEIAFPLSTVRSSRQLAEAIRNAVKCVIAAYEASWLHRDISARNAMLDAAGQGVLNDWDHGFKLDPEDPVPSYRTGTWRFLSVALSQSSKKIHDVLDDLESCFWVFLYNALRFFDSTASADHLALFDYCVEQGGSGISGGRGKAQILLGMGGSIEFSCSPLDDLVEDLRVHFMSSHVARCHPKVNLMEHLRDPGTPILEIFDAALARPDWPNADALEDRFPRSAHASTSGACAQSTPPTQHDALPQDSGLPASHSNAISPSNESRGSLKRRLQEIDAGNSESTRSGSSKRLRSDTTPPSSSLHTPSSVRSLASRSRTRSSKIEAEGNMLRRITRSRTSLNHRITRSHSQRI